MEINKFNDIDPIIDQLAEIADKQLETPEIKKLITKIGEILGENQQASFNITVEIFDYKKEEGIALLRNGLSSRHEGEPYVTSSDSSPQRYVIKEGMVCVPHDYCPECWHVWDFKLQGTSCSNCELTLGDKCKLLLDTDVCPYCENGTVTMTKPKCDQCDFKVDNTKVIWG